MTSVETIFIITRFSSPDQGLGAFCKILLIAVLHPFLSLHFLHQSKCKRMLYKSFLTHSFQTLRVAPLTPFPSHKYIIIYQAHPLIARGECTLIRQRGIHEVEQQRPERICDGVRICGAAGAAEWEVPLACFGCWSPRSLHRRCLRTSALHINSTFSLVYLSSASEVLPLSSWPIIGRLQEKGMHILYFEKGFKDCTTLPS